MSFCKVNTLALFTVALVLSGICSFPADATVLVFEPASDAGILSQDYGDRVVAVSQDGFTYGTDGGFTAHITASYNGKTRLWKNGYGDLANVAYQDVGVAHVIEVTLTADTGWEVILNSFDLGSFGQVDPINAVQVVDGDNNVLFNQDNVDIAYPTHSAFDFGSPIVATELTIRIDPSNLKDIFSPGSSSDFVAIDNIQFGEQEFVIPEPASIAILSIGSLLIFKRRHKGY